MSDEEDHDVGPDRPATQEELNEYYNKVLHGVHDAFQELSHPHPGNNVGCANAIFMVCTELLLRLAMSTQDPREFIDRIKGVLDKGFAFRVAQKALSRTNHDGVH